VSASRIDTLVSEIMHWQLHELPH